MKILEVNNADVSYEEFLEKSRQSEAFKQIEAVCKKYGYVVNEAYYSEVLREYVIDIDITSNADKYMPYIIAPKTQDDFWEVDVEVTGVFTLGRLEPAVNSMNNAFRLLEELEAIDLTTLYSHKEF